MDCTRLAARLRCAQEPVPRTGAGARTRGRVAMSVQPNIGTAHRLFYVLIGVATMLTGFLYIEEGWLKVLLPVLGAGAVIEGLVGW
jgi:hypothetical protein